MGKGQMCRQFTAFATEGVHVLLKEVKCYEDMYTKEMNFVVIDLEVSADGILPHYHFVKLRKEKRTGWCA